MDGSSTELLHAENLAEQMDAQRAKQIARYKQGSRILAVVRGAAVGGLTSYIMTLGAVKSGSQELVQASATVGLVVGGAYSYYLQAFQRENLAWQDTHSLLARDPENRPAGRVVKVIKQMSVPVRLALYMTAGKLVANNFPGVDFKTLASDPSMVVDVGWMAFMSLTFQHPWLEKSKELNKAEKNAAGTDELALARQKYNSDIRALKLSSALALSNSMQLTGLPFGTPLAVASFVVGNIYRKLTAPKKPADGESAPTANRGLASNEGNASAEKPKGLAAKVGGACTASYSALKAVAGRTLASVGVR